MDVNSYRQAEAAGSQAIRALRQIGIHRFDIGKSLGFPSRVDTLDDLVLILDWMHENRFDDFVRELGGLSDADLAEFADAFADYCRFFLAVFQSREITMPLSGMISQYAVARKLRGIPRRRSLLEIGSGTGLMAFFVARDEAIERYDQIEAMECYYLLQNLVNTHVFGHRFVEHARNDPRELGLGGIAFDAIRKARPDVLERDEAPRTLTVERDPRVEHVPWWRLDRILDRRYDVVMSNANLTEFSEPALRYYATLAAQVLKPDGVFLAQCPGGGEIPVGTAIKAVIASGFVPLAIMPHHIDDGSGRPSPMPENKQMALTSFLFLPVRHPHAAKAMRSEPSFPMVDVTDPLTRAVFGLDDPGGPVRTRDDVLAAVAERL